MAEGKSSALIFSAWYKEARGTYLFKHALVLRTMISKVTKTDELRASTKWLVPMPAQLDVEQKALCDQALKWQNLSETRFHGSKVTRTRSKDLEATWP